ncbi:hypothetical protein OTB20_23180 [Streptomyces sp. H27-H1]|uniref:hypothetical protein n=1 Tax=Streptomyces sp. H27-H1 TaxID=2996461 RepID=UPI00226DDFCB|nr:hypothetical protein [Streptomyces sp. H27-H1]MCY0929050.1 hypothetical protein [Streptomyces sp. H27-H1]
MTQSASSMPSWRRGAGREGIAGEVDAASVWNAAESERVSGKLRERCVTVYGAEADATSEVPFDPAAWGIVGVPRAGREPVPAIPVRTG